MAPAGALRPLAARAWRALRDAVRGRRRPGPRPDPELRAASRAIREGRRMARSRRLLFLLLVLGQTAGASWSMAAVLPYHGTQPLEIAIVVLFTILFGWVSIAFWTGVLGFLVLRTRDDRHAITRSLARAGEIPREARTAVIMPICDEHVPRVFAGLRASYASLARTGALDRFDFFVLSDSGDPDARVAETKAWLDLCCAVDGFGRIFYRWRRHRIKRKSGNVADFCRRWGRRYRYMVVLDADSVMSGECLTALVRLMEANPTTGIVQTAPCAAGRETLHARVQQLATRVYGPAFTAGLNFWQLGESYYWGHNAIIRVAPFMRHCALARLPGRGPFSGEILSHDFVEAALMRRAGWAVWMAYDLPGSFEEVPPNLVDELQRERRWCRGNLINVRLFLAEGLHPAHRAVFMGGAMAYVSAPLWLSALALSTAFVVLQTVVGPRYFVAPWQLFPRWPEWHADWAIALAAVTGVVLFVPKLLAGWLVIARGAGEFGGGARLALGLLVELAVSALLAPIRMLFHAQFVVEALTGLRTHWQSPPREDAETGWGEALRRHGAHTVIGISWGVAVYWLAPGFLWWLLPVVLPLALSIPISVVTSRVSLGRLFRRAGLLVIPEEVHPPPELQVVRGASNGAASTPRFTDAVVDPQVNAVACAVAPSQARSALALRASARLVATALRDGAGALGRRERMLLLSDPAALSVLHLEVQGSPEVGARWRPGAAPAP
jgi:membrane glycosyltransferase